jgi:quercetin dioxygenase-like cupin family protein/DNA-binding XRE family transcriptional regulator
LFTRERETYFMEEISFLIRTQRLNHQLTLKQLSEKTGLSKSFLSQIERGKIYPSIATLIKLSHAFEVNVMDLFGEQQGFDNGTISKNGNNKLLPPFEEVNKEESSYITDIKIVRANSRKTFHLPRTEVVYELLTPDLRRKMQVLYVQAKPGDKTGKHTDPPGEKFVLILEGTLEMHIREETHLLGKGDSIYYPANLPIGWHVKGNKIMKMIVAITPPWF